MEGVSGVLATLLYFVSLMHPQIRYTLHPVHVLTAWTENEGEIVVRWSTGLPLLGSTLRYREVECRETEAKTDWVNAEPEWEAFFKYKVIFWEILYTAVMKDLSEECTYEYQVGISEYISDRFRIRGRTPYYRLSDQKANTPSKVIIFGDMGSGPPSLPSRRLMKSLHLRTQIDAILHLGDIAYDLDFTGGIVGDEYLSDIEGICDSLPYMVVPGNHEAAHNFTHYRRRFRMPRTKWNDGSSFFYSFNLGRVHYVVYSTEVYEYNSEETQLAQFNWLKEDLFQAKLTRNDIPWVVVLGHKPLYCNVDWRRSMDSVPDFRSNFNCGPQSEMLRGKFEQLFMDYKVDLVFAGHVHRYEREAAIFHNETVSSESDSEHFHLNPRAPIHIMSGIAGSDHLKNPISSTPQLWNRFENNDYGFGILTAFNKTHMFWEQMAAERDAQSDFLWVVKTHI